MKVAYITGSFPCTSESFIAREIAALTRRGFEITVFALNRPTGPATPSTDGLRVIYRPSICCPCSLGLPFLTFISHPVRSARAWRRIRRSTPEKMSFFKVLYHFLTSLTFSRAATRAGIEHIHAHFAFVTADIASPMCEMLDVRYTVSVHAWDLYVQSPDDIARRVLGAEKVFACTDHGRDRILEAAKLPQDRVVVMRHGLEPGKWTPGRKEESKVILSVGRLVKKKGFLTLIDACRLLKDRGVDFFCSIVGDGPEHSSLELAIKQADLADRVMLKGELTGAALRVEFQRAAVFALPSVVGSDGDRDGLPNTVLEAMASSLPVVVTTASAASEVLQDGQTGYIVEPKDASALAERIESLLADRDTCQRMGESGRLLIEKDFDVDKNVETIIEVFETFRRRSTSSGE